MKKLFIVLILLSSTVFAIDRVSVGYGQDSDNIDVYNIAIQKDFDYKLIENTNLGLEFALEYIDGSNDDMAIISTQPMLSYDITEKFYIEAGVGIAYFTEKELDDNKYGTNFQFKQSIGFGYKITEKIDTTLKYTHYSNADIDDDNSGLDIVMLKFVYKF